MFCLDPTKDSVHHNLPFTVLGTGFLWVGWNGYNAGASLAADGISSEELQIMMINIFRICIAGCCQYQYLRSCCSISMGNNGCDPWYDFHIWCMFRFVGGFSRE